MPTFEYTGRSASGESIRGQVEAASISGVASDLAAKGIVPLNIDVAGAQQAEWLGDVQRWWHRRRISLVDVIMFCRQMTTLAKAGVPITRGLRGLSETMRNPEFGRVLGEVAEQLEKGHELASVLGRYPDIFSNLFVAIIHIGESSGRLEESFEQLHGYLTLEDETRKRIKSALRYPTMVVISMIVAVGVIDIFVVPPFAKMFEGFGSELPWATKLLITTSELTTGFWHVGLAALLLTVWFARKWVATEEGRLGWHRFQLRLPRI